MQRMKNSFLFITLGLLLAANALGQDPVSKKNQEREIHALINMYSATRTEKDSAKLEGILTADIDQLVSSGSWRKGKAEALKGMLQSSESNPGTRSLVIEQIRFLNPDCAIVDARYHIQNPDGTVRKMWSTFIVVQDDAMWKIAAIRNMLPQSNNN